MVSGRFIVMEGYPQVLKMISRPEDDSDRLICPLHELEAPVQKAREKCTQLLQLYCFVSIILTYVLLILYQQTLPKPGYRFL